jgi:TM2 domain-containing membrane protein YozV/RNA polymerase subunit RPABC4/transcription elongation factor Spt4
MYCSNCSSNISDKAEICPKCGVRPFRNKNYCYHCGVNVNEEQEICIDCGVSLNKKPTNASSEKAKEPWLMALLSFFITGLGQMILGQVKKGAVWLIGGFLLALFTAGFSALIIIPLVVIDAFLIAKKMKEGKEVGEWEFF